MAAGGGTDRNAMAQRKAQPGKRDFSALGVSDEDRAELLQCIRLYRDSWMTDRLERFRNWTRNSLFRKGVQVLGWDPGTNNWFDALAWYRQSGRAQDGEDTNLEPFITNVTLTCCNAFVTTLCGGVPRTIILPNDIRVPADVVTAKKARSAVEIVQRMNQISRLIRKQFEHQYDFGCYFKHVRPVLDGECAGYDREAYFEDFEVKPAARMKCIRCGKETPLDQLQQAQPGGGGELPRCPQCGTPMGPESLYGSGEGGYSSLKMAGIREHPRPMVRISVHSPLEIDGDPKAEKLPQTPVLVKEREIDIGEGRMLYPDIADALREGMVSPTSSNAEYERLRRLEVYSMAGGYTADTNQSSLTFSEAWMQPQAFFRTGNMEFANRMKSRFPRGLMIANLGEETVEIREAALVKEWTHCGLMEGYGLFPPAIADRVVPFNKRINNANQVVDDYAQRGSTGLNLIDASRLDDQKLKGRAMVASTLIPVPMKVHGEPKPMAEAMMHFDTPINPQMWTYAQMLYQFLMLIAELPPQVTGGGTQDGVDTGMGQAQMLNRALVVFRGYWENAKTEAVESDENVVYWLKKMMKAGVLKELWNVDEDSAGGFTNTLVAAQDLDGTARFKVNEDQGLPVTPEQLREVIQGIFEQAGTGNPAAIAWLDEPANQEMAISSMVPGSVAPTEAQRIKTLGDLAMLLEQQGEQLTNPDGSPGGLRLPVNPDKTDDLDVAKEVTQRYMQENAGLRFTNSLAWQRLTAYYDAICELDTQKKSEDANRQMRITQAGQPPQQGPDPQTAATLQSLQAAVQDAIQRLGAMQTVDPLLTKGSLSAQVQAGKAILDAGKDAAETVGK